MIGCRSASIGIEWLRAASCSSSSVIPALSVTSTRVGWARRSGLSSARQAFRQRLLLGGDLAGPRLQHDPAELLLAGRPRSACVPRAPRRAARRRSSGTCRAARSRCCAATGTAPRAPSDRRAPSSRPHRRRRDLLRARAATRPRGRTPCAWPASPDLLVARASRRCARSRGRARRSPSAWRRACPRPRPRDRPSASSRASTSLSRALSSAWSSASSRASSSVDSASSSASVTSSGTSASSSASRASPTASDASSAASRPASSTWVATFSAASCASSPPQALTPSARTAATRRTMNFIRVGSPGRAGVKRRAARTRRSRAARRRTRRGERRRPGR